jgi:hypothetical protein
MNIPPPGGIPKPTRANPKNPKDNIWDHMDKETDEFLQTAGPEHFGPRPKTVGWHVAPRTEQRKGKTMSEKLLKIFLFVDRGSWLALYEGDRITIWQTAREGDLDKVVDKAKNPAIKPHSPVTKDVQKLLRECKRGEHDDCCVWSSEKEMSMSENLLRIFHFEGHTRYSWLALYENDRVMWWFPEEACESSIVEKAGSPSGTLINALDSALGPALKALVRDCKQGHYQDNCIWSRDSKPPGLKSGVAMELEAKRIAPAKEFPFAERRLADSFEEFDYSINAPSEGGLSIDVMDRDDDAAERILRARIARQQKWPFCPTHQRNVDLGFNHDGVGRDRVIHEAYWICLDCWQERRGR